MNITMSEPIVTSPPIVDMFEQTSLHDHVIGAVSNTIEKREKHSKYPDRDTNGRMLKGSNLGSLAKGVKNGKGKTTTIKQQISNVQQQVLDSVRMQGSEQLFNRLWSTNTNAMIGLIAKMMPRHQEIDVAIEQKAIICVLDSTSTPDAPVVDVEQEKAVSHSDV